MNILDRYRLSLFCEIITKLDKNPFVKNLMLPQKLSVTPEMAERWPNFWNHRKATIDSFVLNFRFLLMKRDGLSLTRTYAVLTENNIASERTKENKLIFEQFKSQPIPLGFNDKTYTYQDIFETMFYGGLAHFNKEKIKEFITYKKILLINYLCFGHFKIYVTQSMKMGKSLKSDINNAGLI